MKKIALSVLLLFAVVFSANKVFADNISESTARNIAAYYISVMSGKAEAASDQVALVYQFMNDNQKIPTAYIFNIKGQGFVIVSASDYSYPILGFSTEGELDPMRIAPAFLDYFGGYAQRIAYAQDYNTSLFTNTKDIQSEWDALYNRSLNFSAPKAQYWLLDAEWEQGENTNPTYNKLCPSGDNGHGTTYYCYTGCVATAMAMIMHYWKYPVTGKGYIGYSCYINEGSQTYPRSYYGYIDINLADVHYDYANMPNKIKNNTPVNKIDATALLNFHCGVAVQMGYGFEGSGAHSYDVPAAMTNKFKYAYAHYRDRSSYSNDDWVKMLSVEIDSLRPIYYSGYSTTGSGRDAGGHAFVCDGRHPNDGNKFHFNWGWGGTPNTWSDVRQNDINPGSAYGYNFNQGQACIVMAPPADSIPVGVNGVVADLTMPAYPNPASGMVTIPYQIKSQVAQTMSVYTIEGRLIETVELSPAEGRVVLNVSNYAKGVYVYRIGSSSNRFVVK